jgi:hypothetical protein
MTPQWFRTARLAWEHRQVRQRIAWYFDCTWQSAWGIERSRVSSLSPTGCYIEDRFSVPAQGELVQELTVALPTGPVSLQGTVIETMPGVGFAVRFAKLDADTREYLTAFVQRYSAMATPR